jgi:glycosyltransferase involved in cell wall biosynthesis
VKLLSVIHNPVYGGGGAQVLRLRDPLAARGWETLALVGDDGGNLLSRLRDAGVDVTFVPLQRMRATLDPMAHLRLAARFPSDVSAIRRLIRERSIDLVLVHGPTNPQAAVAARLEGAAVVWQIYDSRAPLVVRRAMMPLVVRLADAVTVFGRELARSHPGALRLRDRLVQVLPPVDTSEFDPSPSTRAAARAELNVPDGVPLIGGVANRNPSKGLEYLVRAAARIRASSPRLAVRVLGAASPPHVGYEREVLAEARDLGLDGVVQFVDPGARVPELLPAYDVFVLTSVPRSEGVPTAILEAMTCGLPVVTTEVGGVRELVEDEVTGLVVRPEDPDAIAAAVARLLDDPPLAARLGAEGRRRALERYPLEKLADLHARAYEIALAHRRARRGQTWPRRLRYL